MNVTTATHEMTVQVISLSGRLDALEAGPLRVVLDGFAENGEHHLVVDLREISFVDSAGLAALVKGMRDARAGGGDLRIVRSASPEAERVFTLTRFDQVFAMADSPDELMSDW